MVFDKAYNEYALQTFTEVEAAAFRWLKEG
jgi:hypothetical protein